MRTVISLRYKNLKGLDKMEATLSKFLRGALEGITKRLKVSAISRMRKDSKESVRSLKMAVMGRGLQLSADVWSNLVQAFIDAEGLRKGVFPNFRRGSRLYAWAARHVKDEGKFEKVKTFNFKKGRPRKPSAKKLEVRKLPKRVKGSQPLTQSKRQKAKDSSVKRFAYLVARAVYQKGIKPTFWNREALKANERQIRQDLQNGITRAVNEINRGN